MRPQERKARVRYWINQPPYHAAALWAKQVVVAPERNDPRGVRGAGQPRQAIGIKSCTAYDMPCLDDMRWSYKPEASTALFDSDHFMTSQDLAPAREEALSKGAGNLPVIDDSCRERVQGLDPEYVRLDPCLECLKVWSYALHSSIQRAARSSRWISRAAWSMLTLLSFPRSL